MSDATQSPQVSGGKLVPALLCFFLGYLGVHRFALGKVGTGVFQLIIFLVSVVLYLTLIGALIALPLLGVLGIWILVDFVRILVGNLKR
ncbi:MAG: TM2 domain-containing protein [Opitutaceae bacterium]